MSEVFTGKHEGTLEVSKSLILRGMVIGNLVAASGADIVLHGMVTGDLEVQDGASVVLYGMVNGHTYVDGSVRIYGRTTSVTKRSDAASVFIDPKAIIGDE
ncbi:bactofilin family protein [Anianabacter salinae]|uniref:hypothetical protein n=1 Tax=Anianabacter salinae TaxID=2851023 RepID=UPI00225E2C95|nr:hypothetical protein [Anianabacter salinae]MBV0912235.1 hypothetical protein [Anianabacter salinae]